MRKSAVRPLTRAFRFPTAAPRPRRHRSTTADPIMDIERINAIGNSIADLSERTQALRGYL